MRFLFALILYFNLFVAYAQSSSHFVPCSFDDRKQTIRSKELENIVKADQDERKDFATKSLDELIAMAKHDLVRRKKVARIFAEGCFKTANDYSAAALVYQHGDTADHYFQAYIWAKRAMDLGDASQKYLVANAVDRYLIASQKKQLFATQAFAEKVGGCWCLQPVEKQFSDNLRLEYTHKTLSQAYEWLAALNNNKSCPLTECNTQLQSPRRDTIPGIW